MKNIFKPLAFMGVALAFTLSATAQPMSDTVAKVVRIKGSVRYAMKDNVWHPLKVDDVLQPGAIIQTAADSRADIVLGNKDATANSQKWGETMQNQPSVDQDFVRVYENSVMAIDKLGSSSTGVDQIRETQLDVRAGRIFGTVRKLPKGSKYEVKIPNGIAGIRGTIYNISADGGISVWVGSVVVAYADGSGTIVTKPVAGGQRYDCSTGQYMPIPEVLLRDMQGATNDGRTGVPPGLNNFPEDHNNHYISPTEGTHPGFDVVPQPTPPSPP